MAPKPKYMKDPKAAAKKRAALDKAKKDVKAQKGKPVKKATKRKLAYERMREQDKKISKAERESNEQYNKYRDATKKAWGSAAVKSAQKAVKSAKARRDSTVNAVTNKLGGGTALKKSEAADKRRRKEFDKKKNVVNEVRSGRKLKKAPAPQKGTTRKLVKKVQKKLVRKKKK